MNLLKLIYSKCKVGVRLVLVSLVLIGFYHVFETTRKGGQTYYTNLDKSSTIGFETVGTTIASTTKLIKKLSTIKKIDKQFKESTVEGWDYNTSRDTSLYVLPENITTHLLPEKFCVAPTSLLIIICSSPGNFALRNVIRETWAADRNYAKFTVDIYFLVGQVNNVTMQEQIEQEFLEKNDVIQEHFIDSYNNLTIKSLMILKLTKTHCLNKVNYLMKTDDDVYVNIPPLVNFLQVNGTQDMLIGYLMKGVSPVRDRTSKWNAPYYLYKNSRYPLYLSGSGYVMSVNIVPSLYEASFRHSIFYLEDVYVTGILSEEIRLKPKDHPGFTYRKRDFAPCTYLWAITSHHLNETEMKKLRELIRKTDFRKCKKQPPQKRYRAPHWLKSEKR